MLDVLLQVHDFLRWPILLLGLAGLVWALGPRRRRSAPARLDRGLAGAFVGLLDLQVLLGLVLLAAAWGEGGGLLAHGAVMLGAAILAHLFSRRVRRAEGAAPGRDVTFLFLLPMVLLTLGVTLLLPSV
jgi:hypothetical protein